MRLCKNLATAQSIYCTIVFLVFKEQQSKMMIAYFAVIVALFAAESSSQVARVSPVVLESEVKGECPSNTTIFLRKEALKDEIGDILDRMSSSGPQCPCGGQGSWRRIANIQMNDTTQQCPPAWSLVRTPIRGCGRSSTAAQTCDSAIFRSAGQSYSRVCGRVIGYQKGSPNAFNASVNGNVGLERQYIDGISLTHGAPGRRQHIWSFVTAYYEDDTGYRPDWACACTKRTEPWPYTVPSFIGTNYFCATASPFGDPGTAILTEDPLWDGEGCGPNNDCCEFNNPPWFCTRLPQPTTDDLELRVCHDQTADNEDVIVNIVEMYVL